MILLVRSAKVTPLHNILMNFELMMPVMAAAAAAEGHMTCVGCLSKMTYAEDELLQDWIGWDDMAAR